MELALARVRAADGLVVGTAFLVGQREVLTCAHVVERAQGCAPGAAVEDPGTVLLDFPLLSEPESASQLVAARVSVLVPALADDTGDVAVLTLDPGPPAGASPVRLVAQEDLWGHPCRVFGFATRRDHGVWVSGVLRARQAAGWVQLESSDVTGYAVEAGFSGAPVWDDELSAVVGMAVAAETRGDLRAAYLIPTAALSRAWPPLVAVTRPPCPYRGLAAFREQDEALFFGRAELTAQLVDDVGRGPFVAVVGPSGIGKSSLVFGGVLPLVHRQQGWTTVAVRPAQASGVSALASALLPFLDPDETETQRLAGLARLTAVLRDGHLRDVVERVLACAGSDRLLLIIDQFEEVFARPDEAAEVTGTVLNALDADGLGAGHVLTVLITLRADFLGPALQIPALAHALRGSVTAVGQMGREQLRTVIEGPLPTGVSYEPGLVERILGDVGEGSGSLPLLEFALTQLWERQEHGQLTHAAYQELGGVDGALARYAERVYLNEMTPEDQRQAKRLLVQLVRPTDTGEPVRRVARRPELGEPGWLLGQRLASTRLLVADRDATGAETVELVHEALISGWDRLHDWVEQDRVFRAWQERLRSSIAQWDDSGRDPGALLRRIWLAEAERWLADRPGDIADIEQQYIRASSALQSRSLRRLRAVAAALTLLLLLASGLGIVAISKAREADKQAWLAQSRYLVTRAEQLGASQPDLALLLAAAAYKSAVTEETAANLTSMASRYRYVTQMLATGPVDRVEFSPAQRNVLALAQRDHLSLWDFTRKIRLRSTPALGAYDLAFAPDGQTLAFTEGFSRGGSRVRLWHYANDEPVTLGENRDESAQTGNLQFTADGKKLAACVASSSSTSIQIWSVRPPRRVQLTPLKHKDNCAFGFTNHGKDLVYADGLDLVFWSLTLDKESSRVRVPLPPSESIQSISVTPDGRLAIIEGAGDMVWWDLQTRAHLPARTFNLNSSPVEVSFSRDSRWASLNGIILVDVARREPVQAYPKSNSGLGADSSVLSADGRTVALGDGEAGVVQILQLGNVHGIPSAAHAAFWADGRRVTVVSGSGEVGVWDADHLRPIDVFSTTPRDRPVKLYEDVIDGLSPDGKVYARVDSRNRIVLWDVNLERTILSPLGSHRSKVRALSFDETGKFLASADDSRVIVRHVSGGGAPVVVPLPAGSPVTSVAVSPGGRYVTATTESGSSLWDISSARARRLDLPSHSTSIAFSADNKWLGLSLRDEVIVWDLERRVELRRFRGAAPITFSHDATLIAATRPSGDSSTWTQTIILNLRNGHIVGSVDSQEAGNGSLTFTADDSQLAIAGGEVLASYPFDPSWALQHICHMIGRNITQTEWKQLGEGFRYVSTCP